MDERAKTTQDLGKERRNYLQRMVEIHYEKVEEGVKDLALQ